MSPTLRHILCVLMLVLCKEVSAQLDTIHWIPPMHGRIGNGLGVSDYLYISTPEANPVSYTIADGGGNILNAGTLTNATPVTYHVGDGSQHVGHVTIDELNTVLDDRGLIVLASDSIYVNYRTVTINTNNQLTQAGSLTAKGLAAVGTEFRVGGTPNEVGSNIRSSFFSVMALMDNTTINVTDLSPGMVFNGNPTLATANLNYTLNAGQTIVFSVYTDIAPNADGLLGAHLTATNPIVLNNGVWHGNFNGLSGQDIGIDQSVPVPKLGTEFICIRGGGVDGIESPVIIAHYNNTQIFVNGAGVPMATINAGDYFAIPGTNYSAGQNMFIRTSQPAYCYQSLSGAASTATGGMNFVPAISCGMPKTVDLIPAVNMIGNSNFIGGITAFTTSISSLTVTDANGMTFYPAGSGSPVSGAPGWQTFKIQGLVGNTRLESTGAMSASIFGANNVAGFAAFFSGFDADIQMTLNVMGDTCLNTTELGASSIFEDYHWYLDGVEIAGADSNYLIPDIAGTYKAWAIFNGCPDSAEVEVYPLPIKPLNDTALCDGQPLILDASSAGVIFSWSTGGVTPQISPTTTGTYWVDITTDHACSDRDSVDVLFHPLPLVDLGPDISICSESDTVLDAGPNMDVYDWSDGSTLQTLTVSDPGIYYVTVTDSNTCVGSDTIEVFNFPLPIFDIVVDEVCQESLFQPTNNSYVPNGGMVASTEWTFGDGNASSVGSPQHVYAISGVMDLTLSVTSTDGCEVDTAFQNTVHPKPVADFTVTNVCADQEVPIQHLSSVANPGNIAATAWDMGDGVSYPDTSFSSYAYAAFGSYDVELAVETTDGCQDTLVRTVHVHPMPTADFSFVDICETDSVQFVDQSAVASGVLAFWQWDFGNGNTSTAQTGGYQTYPADDFYEVSLTATTDSGCVDMAVDTIEIFPSPIADFTFDSVCYPLPIQFADLSDPNGAYDITNWLWTYSNGQTSSTPSPAITFPQFGAYGATLVVTNQVGCKDQITLGDVLVHPLPVAAYLATLGHCHHDTATFEDQSSVDMLSDDEIMSWLYTFGDGSISAQPFDQHVYQNYGFYPTQLVVVTNHGCSDSSQQTVEVYPRPMVDFAASPSEGCQPLYVQFLDQTSIPTPYVLASWQWNLGDNASFPTNRNPYLTYNPNNLGPFDEATYDVQLTVTSGNGCVSDTLKVSAVTVYPKPIAAFATRPEEIATAVHPLYTMNDQSTVNVNSWDWDFGDGAITVVQNPEHLYLDTGLYEIILIVSTEHNCRDTVTHHVKVQPEYHFYIPSAFTPNNDGTNDTFFGSGEFFTDYQMSVYDRWGGEIFHSANADLAWDGTYKGKQVEQGVYIYQFVITDWEGNQRIYRGGVSLLR